MTIYGYAYRVSPAHNFGTVSHTFTVTCTNGVITTSPTSIYFAGGDENKNQGIQVYISNIVWSDYQEL